MFIDKYLHHRRWLAHWCPPQLGSSVDVSRQTPNISKWYFFPSPIPKQSVTYQLSFHRPTHGQGYIGKFCIFVFNPPPFFSSPIKSCIVNILLKVTIKSYSMTYLISIGVHFFIHTKNEKKISKDEYFCIKNLYCGPVLIHLESKILSCSN